MEQLPLKSKFKDQKILIPFFVGFSLLVIVISFLILRSNDSGFTAPSDWLTYDEGGYKFSYPEYFIVYEQADSGVGITNFHKGSLYTEITQSSLGNIIGSAEDACERIPKFLLEVGSDLPSPVDPYDINQGSEFTFDSDVKIETELHMINGRTVCSVTDGLANYLRYPDDPRSIEAHIFFIENGNKLHSIMFTVRIGEFAFERDEEETKNIIKTIEISDDIEMQEFEFPQVGY